MRLSRFKEMLNSSLTAKIFSICFLSVHVPLLALVVYLFTGLQADATVVFLLVLGATLVGTAFCLASMWMLISPLREVAGIVETYRSTGTVTTAYSKRRDEVGIVTNGVSQLVSELNSTLLQLRRQSNTDVLTGLGNRRWLNEIAGLELNRAAREQRAISVIVFDLDHFKGINDKFGHDVGDQVLMATGATIQHCLRPYDIAARIGGEEFCLVLPGTDIDAARSIADRLRTQLESKAIGPLPKGRVTASFGVYRGDPTRETLKAMLTVADRKLYDAKHAGRNAIHSEVAYSIRNAPVTTQKRGKKRFNLPYE